MVRPAKYDREVALKTAMNSIWANGLKGSSVKQLSELLGMTRSSFYNAFGTQDDLFRACLPGYAAQSPDAPLHEKLSGEVLPLINQVFRDICHARSKDPEGRGCMIVNTISELCPDEEGIGAELGELVLNSASRLEDLLKIAEENGEIELDGKTRATALALQNLMVGLNVICKVVRNEEELWSMTKTTLQGLRIFQEEAHA